MDTGLSIEASNGNFFLKCNESMKKKILNLKFVNFRLQYGEKKIHKTCQSEKGPCKSTVWADWLAR